MLKIPNGGRQTSWLFTKRGLGFGNTATVKQIQVVTCRAGLEPGGLWITSLGPKLLGHAASLQKEVGPGGGAGGGTTVKSFFLNNEFSTTYKYRIVHPNNIIPALV